MSRALQAVRTRAVLVRTGLALAVGCALVGAAPAGAGPVFDDADAADLAGSLAEATEVQGICYGWSVDVEDRSASTGSGLDVGSGSGAGVPVDQARCGRYVIFEATLRYTPESSESEDSATFRLRSNLDDPPTQADLQRAGVSTGGLLGEQGDQEVADAVLALPALVAATGQAPPVIATPDAEAMPATDGPTGTPGSDFLRRSLPLVLVGGALAAAGVIWCVVAVAVRPGRGGEPRRERGDDRGSGVGPVGRPGGGAVVQPRGPGAARRRLPGGGPADPR